MQLIIFSGFATATETQGAWSSGTPGRAPEKQGGRGLGVRLQKMKVCMTQATGEEERGELILLTPLLLQKVSLVAVLLPSAFARVPRRRDIEFAGFRGVSHHRHPKSCPLYCLLFWDLY